MHSDDFNAQGIDKTALKGFYFDLYIQGILENTTVRLEEIAIAVDGNTATATPLVINTPTGKLQYLCELKKETDGIWRFISIELIY